MNSIQNNPGSSFHFKGERHYSKGWVLSHHCLPAETKEAGHGCLHRLLHSFSFCFDKTSAKAATLKPCAQPLSSCSRHMQEAEKLHTWWVVRPGGRVREEMGRSVNALRRVLARDSHLRPRHNQGTCMARACPFTARSACYVEGICGAEESWITSSAEKRKGEERRGEGRGETERMR